MNRNTFKERDREPTKETHETLVWDTNETPRNEILCDPMYCESLIVKITVSPQ